MMFTKPLEYIITKENLLNAYDKISKNSSGILSFMSKLCK